jgi:hypothetical protein
MRYATAMLMDQRIVRHQAPRVRCRKLHASSERQKWTGDLPGSPSSLLCSFRLRLPQPMQTMCWYDDNAAYEGMLSHRTNDREHDAGATHDADVDGWHASHRRTHCRHERRGLEDDAADSTPQSSRPRRHRDHDDPPRSDDGATSRPLLFVDPGTPVDPQGTASTPPRGPSCTETVGPDL